MISEATGLQAKVKVVVLHPVVITGGAILSAVHVTVVEAGPAELPQASTAVNVLVCVTVQLLVVTAASEEVTVDVPHASVAVAVPSAALISDAIRITCQG